MQNKLIYSIRFSNRYDLVKGFGTVYEIISNELTGIRTDIIVYAGVKLESKEREF